MLRLATKAAQAPFAADRATTVKVPGDVGAVVVIDTAPELFEVDDPTSVPPIEKVTSVFAQKPLTLRVSRAPAVGAALLASTVGTPPCP
jgi:hypothetical protein